MLNHWEALTAFHVNGLVEFDKNSVERGIRPTPLEGKNARFARANSGGERWAILASLINTAKLHGIDPQTHLADILDRVVPGRANRERSASCSLGTGKPPAEPTAIIA